MKFSKHFWEFSVMINGKQEKENEKQQPHPPQHIQRDENNLYSIIF